MTFWPTDRGYGKFFTEHVPFDFFRMYASNLWKIVIGDNEAKINIQILIDFVRLCKFV